MKPCRGFDPGSTPGPGVERTLLLKTRPYIFFLSVTVSVHIIGVVRAADETTPIMWTAVTFSATPVHKIYGVVPDVTPLRSLMLNVECIPLPETFPTPCIWAISSLFIVLPFPVYSSQFAKGIIDLIKVPQHIHPFISCFI